MKEKVQLPKIYQEDVHRAVEILKEAGCTHVFLFGSLSLLVGLEMDQILTLPFEGALKEDFSTS